MAQGIEPRRTETDEDVKGKSVFIAGMNYPTEQKCWLLFHHFSEIDGLGTLEDGRVESGGMSRDQESRLLPGAMFVRCSSQQAAKEMIKLIDGAPTLEGRRVRAMFSAFGIFPAQKWKQEQFPIGTNRSPEMLIKCPEDINDVDTGVMAFGMECAWCGLTWHSISCCEEWNDFKKSCPKDVEANGGHHKCEKCGAIDVHPLEKCKMIEIKGLAPRNVASHQGSNAGRGCTRILRTHRKKSSVRRCVTSEKSNATNARNGDTRPGSAPTGRSIRNGTLLMAVDGCATRRRTGTRWSGTSRSIVAAAAILEAEIETEKW